LPGKRAALCGAEQVHALASTPYIGGMRQFEEHTMNRDQIKGAAKNVAGKVQQKVGALTGNRTQQVRGISKQVEGQLQKGAGDVERALDKLDTKLPEQE
jgi:uncharacterized protein YjbJ (UPF0337 family)